MTENYRLKDGYTCRIIRTLDEFREVREVWNDHADKFGLYDPWFCWEWFNLYIEHFSDWDNLLIVLVYNGNDLRLIAPLTHSREKYKGVANVNKIELLGNAHSTARAVIFKDVDVRTRIDDLKALLAFFKYTYKKWDIIELQRIPGQNCVPEVYIAALKSLGFTSRAQFSCGNWYINGGYCSSEEYFSSRPKDFMSQIENKKKRLSKLTECDIRMVIDSAELEGYLNLYDEIRNQSWKAPEHGRIFVREFTQYAAEKGWLRLAMLFSGEKPIAAQKWIVSNRKAYIWDLVHDERYGKYSPGSIVSVELFKYVIDVDKVVEIDYLTGDEPYKKVWTPQRRERKKITLFNRNLKGRIFSFLMLSLLRHFKKIKVPRVLRSLQLGTSYENSSK